MPNEKKDQQPLINRQWSWFFCALSRRRLYGYVCHICYSLLLHSVQRPLSFNFDYSLLAVLCVTTCQPIGFRLYFRFLMVIGFLLYFFLSSTLCVLILSDTLAAIFWTHHIILMRIVSYDHMSYQRPLYHSSNYRSVHFLKSSLHSLEGVNWIADCKLGDDLGDR